MLYINIAIALCALVRFGSEAALCTFDKLALPVSPAFCDTSKCLPLSQDELEELVNQDYKVYTWTRGDNSLVGFCSINFKWTFSATDSNLTITYRSQKKCVEEAMVTRVFTGKTDPATEEYKGLKLKQGNDEWDFCYPFFISGGPFAYRFCRQSPYSSGGTGFEGFMYVFEPAVGSCQRDKTDAYLKTLENNPDAYWKEIGVDC